ncbi:MAG TPA: GvpL/GvpF family gas vesicle protein, partial [Myxococcales bacterium]|nr:GvpL/GvpF family gas vesicle protein [Myxococcales bacterium]
MTLWIYGWTSAPPRRLGRGAAGEPLRALRLRPGLFAVAGEMAQPLAGSLPALKAQDRVVRRLLSSVGTLAPARFGSAVEDEGQLRRAMEGRGAALVEALSELRGKVQMTARGFRAGGKAPRRRPLPKAPGGGHPPPPDP